MMRRRYSIGDKLKLVDTINRLTTVGEVEGGDNVSGDGGPISIRQACSRLKVEPSSYRKWKKQITLLRSYKSNKLGTKFRMHRGRPPFVIDDIEEELVDWLLLKVFEVVGCL